MNNWPSFIFAAVVALLTGIMPAAGADSAAQDLLNKMAAAQESRGAIVRMRLVTADPATGQPASAQLLMKVRRGEGGERVLCQVLWPARHKAEAVSLEVSTAGAVTGFLFTPPDKVTELTPAALSRPYLDSDLAIEDLADDFLHWPAQKISGDEVVNGEPCKILESRPGAKSGSSYSLVRSWISTGKLIPLRIEKFGHDGRLQKQVAVQKTARQGSRWVPLAMEITSPGRNGGTTLDISRGNSDREIPPSDFSVETVRKGLQ